MSLKQSIKNHAHRLGFTLAGVTSPDQPLHFSTYVRWVDSGYHGEMHYLANDLARTKRSDPRQILPECQSILMLAIPYANSINEKFSNREEPIGKVASYAWGNDYHMVLPGKLQELVGFIEDRVGSQIPNRYYTDTGPILERDIAQHAGLGWIGKNTCLINPKQGSYFFLAEILLGLELEPDTPFVSDHCGTCSRCIEACPTNCILPDRTIDATRCISYLTIELKSDVPTELRPKMQNWIFGCDVCQIVCPWNRFADQDVDATFSSRAGLPTPNLIQELTLSPEDFNRKFKDSPIKRAKRRGYLRNVATALGNSGHQNALSALETALEDAEPTVRKHAKWAKGKINAKDHK